ncbi:MAG: LysR family transcriptional regulator, partial [Acidisphaera sp.]|nr:LysR family transcriptional regulator [Acidisphaera sp.]MBV9813057.1 LysR family transcriptional regulator [Acetobacteraceae bacterium]
MSLPIGLDPDLLRAFVFIAEDGSFTRAAERVGRTQSAVSMQMQRLEAALGEKVLLRGKGGSVQLTPHGRYLLERARTLLALNDEIWTAFREPAVRGTVRLGTPDDYAMRFLPPVLKRFADTHPAVEVDVLCEPSHQLVEHLRAGDLDLTLCSEGHAPRNWPTTLLWRGPLFWITSERHAPHRLDPLPLALSATQCSWRQAALETLDRAGRHYRVGYTSATLAGTHVPVLAGLAITVSPITLLPDGLRLLRPDEGLPKLPDAGILLLKGRNPAQPLTDVLAAHIAET